MHLFREKVERHLHPIPSQDELKVYFKHVETLSVAQLDTPVDATQSIGRFAGIAAFPDDPTWSEEELAWAKDNKKNITRQVSKAWYEDADASFCANSGPVLYWFGMVLGQSACNGKFEFFTRLEHVIYHDPDVSMHWSVLGWNVQKLLDMNMVLPTACVCPKVKTMALFESLGSEVMGAFANELVEVQGILEGQQSTVQNVKNKVLAGMVSAGIAVANVVSGRILQAWKENSD